MHLHIPPDSYRMWLEHLEKWLSHEGARAAQVHEKSRKVFFTKDSGATLRSGLASLPTRLHANTSFVKKIAVATLLESYDFL